MDIQDKIDSLTERIAQEFNSVDGKLGNLSSLTTQTKTNIVGALIELKESIDSLDSEEIVKDNLNSSENYTWSITKIKSHINSMLDSLFSGAPGDLDSIVKITTAINLIKQSSLDLVSYSEVQEKSDAEKLTARTNIGSASQESLSGLQDELTEYKVNIGSITRNFVSDFENELI